MDWADEIAAGLSPIERRCDTAVCVYQHQCMCAAYIAAALRKAMEDGEAKGERKGRVSGLREAAEFVTAHVEYLTGDKTGLFRKVSPRTSPKNTSSGIGYADYFHDRASQIEKGN